MSLLMFALAPTQVVVVTDTLSTNSSGDPHIFVSKCAVIPHLEMVVAATGIGLVGHRWAQQLQTAVLARDIDLLDRHVPLALRKIEADLIEEFGELPGTSTVYHFGYSEGREAYVCYVYRSDRKFAPEQLESGFGVKPVPVGDFTAPTDIAEMVQLGQRIRSEQDSLPADKRIHIGGEFWMTVLVNRSIQITKLFRYEDFEEHWLTMNQNIQ